MILLTLYNICFPYHQPWEVLLLKCGYPLTPTIPRPSLVLLPFHPLCQEQWASGCLLWWPCSFSLSLSLSLSSSLYKCWPRGTNSNKGLLPCLDQKPCPCQLLSLDSQCNVIHGSCFHCTVSVTSSMPAVFTGLSVQCANHSATASNKSQARGFKPRYKLNRHTSLLVDSGTQNILYIIYIYIYTNN